MNDVEELSSRENKIAMTYLDLLSVKVLNGRVILFDEASGNELDGQGRFAYSATAQHHNFEFTHSSDCFPPPPSPRRLLLLFQGGFPSSLG